MAGESRQLIARRALVSGRVQGVWFRDWTRRAAQTLRVSGWARNLPDGTVEVWAEGEPQAVEALLDHCRQGPPRAQVERLSVQEVAPAERTDFQVR